MKDLGFRQWGVYIAIECDLFFEFYEEFHCMFGYVDVCKCRLFSIY